MTRQILAGVPAVGILFDLFFNSFEFMLAFSELIFPIFAMLYGTILPHIGIMDHERLTSIFLFLAVFYLVNMSINTWEKIQNGRLNDSGRD